jgi:peptide/nickel transport system substrate-binding protein
VKAAIGRGEVEAYPGSIALVRRLRAQGLRTAAVVSSSNNCQDVLRAAGILYRGASHKLLKGRVAAIETPDPSRVRIRLRSAWPDFMTFYVSATGAAWIVPKKYVEKVGDEGFKKAPIGAGPYRFVSFTPGVEVVLEAFDQYWRKTPEVKRLVLKSIPDEATRLAALKRGEVDIAYAIRGPLAEDLQRTPGLTLKPQVGLATHWVYFTEQWDPKSPWHDRRVRLAANHALDRQAINQADALGHARLIWSIIPNSFEFYWQPPGYGYEPARAKQLLAQAGYPGGFDAGDYFCDAALTNLGEPVVNYLSQRRRHPGQAPADRARRILQGVCREEIPGVDPRGQRCLRQRRHPDRGVHCRRRHVRVRKLRRHRRALPGTMVAPIYLNAAMMGFGPRVQESGIGLISGYLWSAPYEDVKLKGK